MIEFLALPGIKRFLSKFDNPRQMLFMHYCLLYLKIYQSSCSFEINVTDRYPSRANEDEVDTNKDEKQANEEENSSEPHLEGCVVAKHLIKKGEHIPYLEGWLAGLEDDVDQTFQGETDFSIIHTSRNGNANLLLGPARFVNHDCNPNCSFSRKGKKISLRAIKEIHVGQEVTVTYAKNYFGYRNRECRCVSCEIRGVNGFGSPNEYPSDDDSSDTDFLTKLKRRNRKSYRLNLAAAENLAGSGTDPDAGISPAVAADPVDSEISLQSSRSPSAGVEVDTPATSIEPDPVAPSFSKFDTPKDVPLKRRLRQREGFLGAIEDRLFKFSFDDDDENFTNTREEWKQVCRGLSKEDRDVYTLHDYIFHKLSDQGRFKDLQRFYFSSPIDADLDLTLDCVNCGSPFFGPDDRVAPRRLPTRMCPRCHRHAVVFNAYWPSTEALDEKIELLRAWDFTSLKDIGERGEFVPPDDKKKKGDKDIDSTDASDSDSASELEAESESDVSIKHVNRRHTLPKRGRQATNRRFRSNDSESDSDEIPKPRPYHRSGIKLLEHPPKSQKRTYGRLANKRLSLASLQKSISPLNPPRKRGRPRTRFLDITPVENTHTEDSLDEDSESVAEVPRTKRKYTKRFESKAGDNPRRSSRLSLDPVGPTGVTSASSRPSRDRFSLPKRPLYVVPLNANKPTCILLPPTEDSDPISIPATIDFTVPSLDAHPKRALRGTMSLDHFPVNTTTFNFPCMTTPSLPASSPLIVSEFANAQSNKLLDSETEGASNDPPPQPTSHASFNAMRTGGRPYPKVKTYGLSGKPYKSAFYATPSWKLLQDIQFS